MLGARVEHEGAGQIEARRKRSTCGWSGADVEDATSNVANRRHSVGIAARGADRSGGRAFASSTTRHEML